MMTILFGDFDITGYWVESDSANTDYVGEPLTNKMVTSIENELGYKLPRAYIELLRSQNGGIPRLTCHRVHEPLAWAEPYITISRIFGMDRSKPYSLCGSLGSRFFIDELGYPPIGVYFCNTPSAGHDMVCLDYRKCGPDGEPAVIHIDQEAGFRITFVAENFETFIRGLESDEGLNRYLDSGL
jgi:hypothetical protein